MPLNAPSANLPTEHFDVIAVGGGHAGCEAAITAARLGCSAALLEPELLRWLWDKSNLLLVHAVNEELRRLQHLLMTGRLNTMNG